MTPDDVAELLDRAADGDAAAWNTIVEDYSVLLRSVVRGFRLGEARSADAVQLTWLRLIQNLDRIRDPRSLAGWLRITAYRICVNMIRESAHELPVDGYEDRTVLRYGSAGSEAGPEESLLRRERVTLVRRAVGRLPERHRELLTMLLASPPLSYGEISDRLGIPIGSIGPTRARILQRLRMDLESQDVRDFALG
ncbi:RNA polymerase sigma factor [Amorphoplanes digitatis]|uniref:RNA polymerase sigma factor (Sigma-70 family) n=1 Tax=Actinoplanes digitatis TaxID=1868 RepID=A0A7W7HYD4_9ACTN|nr:sigma-70 family RNA polymerase sigma factor [Actinoplanes digitatis]MBB4762990.1 RNA polymerase sigma factor (sigma-70 family) [Actinoplanes digitatis]BFE71960.1 sigma-70 family RNA polymerase sigma factor [Actinoplanes digitatis]GID95809.1 RNA polymerase sigma factor [Actinoplanes digitatis]